MLRQHVQAERFQATIQELESIEAAEQQRGSRKVVVPKREHEQASSDEHDINQEITGRRSERKIAIDPHLIHVIADTCSASLEIVNQHVL